MSQSKTGNTTHDNIVSAAESVRQSAVRVPGVSQAAVVAAELISYRACLASAIANGIERGVFIGALWQLGVRDV
jgi:hypothetical protein